MALAGAAAALATAATATTTAGAPLAEHVLWEGVPSLKAMMLEIVVTALYAVVLPIAAVLAFDRVLAVIAGLGADSAAFVASNRPTLKQAVTALVVIVVVVRVAKLAWHAAVLRSHHYRVSNHRIVVESGVLSKRIDEVDMRTVEDIEFRQMPMQRLFGIGDIAIVSADKQMARFRLVGVEKPRDLRELIRSSAFQATRGQLFTRTT
ncbi:MAG: PH domain-containing protein [Myxococcales bacterium]